MSRTSHTARERFLLGSFALSTCAAALLASPTAFAQEEAEADDNRRLQTVTVTATKREQTLQDIPVAVSVVDEAVIEKAEIIDLGDLQSIVPSLTVGQLQSSANTNFIIRGFGNGANNVGIEPSVGVFVDGVYRSRSAAQIADLPNLQRVEVLRGPQSTLFGKNASAGVISIVTEAPQFELGGGVEATIGNYETFRLKADVTGPITDTLAFSLAGNLNQRAGYARDTAANIDVNERDRYGFRGQLLWEPMEDLSFRVIGDYDNIDENCCVAGNVINGPTGAAVVASGGSINFEDPFSYEVLGNFPSENDITNKGVSLQADWDFDFATLTSITSQRRVEAYTNQDSDFTSADLIGLNEDEYEIDTFTQELRLTSNTDTRLDWMVGAYYFDEEIVGERAFAYGADYRTYGNLLADPTGASDSFALVESIVGVPVGTTFAQAGQGPSADYGQDNTAFSIFGTVDFHITDRLTATLGVNYTEDEKDTFYTQVNTDAFSNLDLVSIGEGVLTFEAFNTALADLGVDPTDDAQVAGFAAANPAAFAQVQAGAAAFGAANAADPAVNPLLGFQAFQFLPQFLNYPNVVEDGQSEDEQTTYTARLAYDVTDNVNAYISYATGFKATSWNLSRDSRPFPADLAAIQAAGIAPNNLTTGTRFAEPEDSEVYEIGMKASFDTVAFNLAIFEQKIENFQSNPFIGTGFVLLNAEEQSTQGLEIDVTWSPIAPLTLVFAGTFLDPVYDEFTGAYNLRDANGNVTGALGDLSGEQPALVPEVTTSLAANYDFTLNNGWDAYIRADWQYQSEAAYFDDPFNVALINGEELDFSLVNASVGFTTDTDLTVSLWGRNIFEEEFITTAFPAVAQAGSISGYPNQPQTFGITVRQRY